MCAGVLLFLVAITTARAVEDTKSERYSSYMTHNSLLHDYEPAVPVRRQKRMAINFAKIGKIAAQKILDGATPVLRKGSKYRNYEKDGSIGTAMHDFYSVRPVKVAEFTTLDGVRVLKGKAGDRALSLYTRDYHGFPVLEIADFKNRHTHRYVDRIVYKKGVTKPYDF